MKGLSNVLSEAILQALEDLEAIKNNDKYIINFSVWHEPDYTTETSQFNDNNNNKKCSVCYAGSVMANRLGANFKRSYDPSYFDEEPMLKALDRVRKGDISGACEYLKLDSSKLKYQYITVSEHNYTEFVTQMKEVSKDLKEVGY